MLQDTNNAMKRQISALSRSAIVVLLAVGITQAADLPRIKVSEDHRTFILEGSTEPFTPWGFNYDHDRTGRLLEDYWHDEWPTVEADFAEMKELGANTVRIHLQFGRFMNGPNEPNARSLDRLADLLKLAERTGVYLDLTGLGCYHKKDVPPWYDALDEAARWNAQAAFWRAVAGRCRKSPAVFCYDLMNEPVVPGGRRNASEWLGGALGDKHFVQFITLDSADRPRPEIAKQWIDHLVAEVREVDDRHLITVGLVDWSLARPGLTSGFVPREVADKLDFIAVHIYPEKGKLDDALETLAGFQIGKPVVIEEIFPLKCTTEELSEFIDRSKPRAAGWIGFYWGQTLDELRESKEIGPAITREWLELFRKRAKRS
jgi:hypothetical protein